MVINTSTLNIDGQTYNRGDIVIKDNNGNQVIVPNEQSGAYYPQKIESDELGNMTLSFQYEQTPSAATRTLTIDNPIAPSDGHLYSYAIKSTDVD